MKLTLEQAASRLGKSVRQIRYMIKEGQLPAEKVAGRWFIDSDDLSTDSVRQKTSERRQRQLRAAVEEALEVDTPEERQKRYSVWDLKAFKIGVPLYRETCKALSEEHPAATALRFALTELCRGCHRFDRAAKAEAYRAARDAVSEAVCELALADTEPAGRILRELEQEMMAALAGLLRRVDRRQELRGSGA